MFAVCTTRPLWYSSISSGYPSREKYEEESLSTLRSMYGKIKLALVFQTFQRYRLSRKLCPSIRYEQVFKSSNKWSLKSIFLEFICSAVSPLAAIADSVPSEKIMSVKNHVIVIFGAACRKCVLIGNAIGCGTLKQSPPGMLLSLLWWGLRRKVSDGPPTNVIRKAKWPPGAK